MLDIANPEYDPLDLFSKWIYNTQRPYRVSVIYDPFSEEELKYWLGINAPMSNKYLEIWTSLGLIQPHMLSYYIATKKVYDL